jgi:hypothetical protein
VSITYPLRYEGGGVFRCLHPNRVVLDIGEVHGWQMAENRSKASHDHFFAVVNEAWKSLPEDLCDDFPSPEHLRKWALIKAGFCTATKVVCANNDEAIKLVGKAKAMDRYSLVDVAGSTVTIWTADSQRRDAMGRSVFQEAKEKAIDAISALLGTDAATLKAAAQTNPQ